MDTTPAPMLVDSPPLPETRDFYTPSQHDAMDLKVRGRLKENRAQWRKNSSLSDLRYVLFAVAESDPKLDRKYLNFDTPFPHNETKILSNAWKANKFKAIRIRCSLQAPKTEASISSLPAPEYEMMVDSPPTRDFYTLADHKRMDLQVEARLQNKKAAWREEVSSMELEGVLREVVLSDNRLDRKYLTADIADPEVLQRLSSAWKVMEFQSVRILCSLQAPKTNVSIGSLLAPESDMQANLAAAMTQSYEGNSVKALIYYLEFNNLAYSLLGRYYGKFCSIAQSSGTGKTRLLFELGKQDICVLYMNIRSTDDKGYPPRDDIPADILTQTGLSEKDYGFQCQVFFAAVFKCLGAFLEETNPFGVLSDVGNDRRTGFFKDVKRELVNVVQEMRQSSSVDVMKNYLRVMVRAKVFPQDNKVWPRVVIALDESHVLHEKVPQQEYLWATVLLRTFKAFSGSESVWVLFASTVSKVADFASPQVLFPSARVAVQGQLLFPPFTLLGWDQCTPALEDVELDKVAWGSHLLRYGRPLWWSLKHYDVAEIMRLAQQKLCASQIFDPYNRYHAFAVLGQRFGLDIAFGHREAVKYNDDFIASHLRICIKTTEDRMWSYTTYPSEPIVSVAAAQLLYEEKENLGKTLGVVSDMVNNGLINRGDSGELASRFIWLLAKDLCAHKNFVLPSSCPQTSDAVKRDYELPYCQLVPVVEFLEVIFGSKITQQAPGLKTTFGDAYINFSHWIQMGFDITRGKEGKQNDVSIEEWTESLWARTSAVQCCHNQPAIDKVIPMFFKSQPREKAMSHILISDKARDDSQLKILDEITRNHPNITPADYSGLPYIGILADLGVKDPSPSERLIVHDESGLGSADRCLRIYAAGLDCKTYEFLEPEIARQLNDLYERRTLPPRFLKVWEELEDRVQIGLSRERRYLNWKKKNRAGL